MRLGIAGFAKYLRKSPPDDQDIAEALTWVRDMAEQVLDTAEPVADQLELSDEQLAQDAEDQLMTTLDASETVEATA